MSVASTSRRAAESRAYAVCTGQPASVAAAAEFSRVFEECVIHYGDTTGKVLTTLYDETQNGTGGSGYVSAVALEETSLLNYNQGNPDSHTVQPGEEPHRQVRAGPAEMPAESRLDVPCGEWSCSPDRASRRASLSACDARRL